ncbi:MAG: sigma-54 dependent transcriptional regulator [bacterium]
MMDKILIVDDESNIRNSLRSVLSDEGYSCFSAANGVEALRTLQTEGVDLIITDLIMPEMDGLQLLEAVRKYNRDVRIIMLTAYGTVESAVQAMKHGAVDFLLKPIDFDILLLKVKDCFQQIELKRELLWFKEQCRNTVCGNCLNLIGESAAWKNVLNQARKVADSDINVLVSGESGVGKEVLARLIHLWSRRNERPFVPVNCSGLPETLLESELFGVIKGAYSGAVKDREGLIRTAKDGTVFLDEISELSLRSQAKFLRVLEDGEVKPLGSDRTYKASCRFLAASNRDLRKEVEQGQFREDLFYRISSFQIHIPPLRERWEDIPDLAKQFVYCSSSRENRNAPLLTSEVVSLLQSYSWPGNVRQLKNVIRSAILFHEGEYLTAHDFPQEVFESTTQPAEVGLRDVIARFERSYITRVLQEHHGDKKATAEKLKISLTTLYQKIKDLDIPAPDFS